MNSINKIKFFDGIIKVFPLFIGVIPFGIAYGITAKIAGISAIKTISMSLLVFAGAAQFVAVEMYKNHNYIFSILFMTLIINLRHILMSMALKPYWINKPRVLKILVSFGIHDESFIVSINDCKKNNEGSISFFIGASLLMYIGWVGGSTIGYFLGYSINDPFKWGIDFTMIITFISMLIPQITNKTIFIVVIISGIVSVFTSIFLSSSINIIIATIMGAFTGFLLEEV